jgi:prephenate dehydrogenase
MAQLTVIGTGLIGTSLALGLKQSRGKDLELVGTDSNGRSRNGAQKSQAFDRVDNNLYSSIRDAKMVVLATPVMAMEEIMQAIGNQLPEGCVVTDVGSSKKVVLEWAERYLPERVEFVGGHPMAGRETPGPENADASLFQDRVYCVIPSPRASQRAVSEVTSLVDAVGARPYFISVDEHDSFVAAASHLPFLLSVALMGCTSKSGNWSDIGQLAASGFDGMTRLASGDAVMHRDICLSNPEPIVAWIDAFIRELYEIRQLLEVEGTPDSAAVEDVFQKCFEARQLWLAGDFNRSDKAARPTADMPTMGEAFFGTRLMEYQRRFLGGGQGKNEGRK